MYAIDARATLRAFIRKMQKAGHYRTANGKVNLYAGRTQLALRLRTASSKKPITLRYRVIRAAIQQTYYARTVTRKELEAFTRCANSALLGILIEIFGERGRIYRSSSGLVRLTLRGVRYFFAGADRVKRDLEIAAANGAKFVLMTYAHIRNRSAWKTHVLRLGLKVLLDSGAFTVWQSKKKGKAVEPIALDAYIAFIRKHEDVLFGYFNLDVIQDAAASKVNAESMKAAGLKPIEVWHIGSPLRALEELVKEDHPVIAIGGSVGISEKVRRRVFRWVFKLFPQQNFHFLGGSSQLLQAFPWFSADSRGWAVGRQYGAIIDERGQRKAPSEMSGLEAMAYNTRYLSALEMAG